MLGEYSVKKQDFHVLILSSTKSGKLLEDLLCWSEFEKKLLLRLKVAKSRRTHFRLNLDDGSNKFMRRWPKKKSLKTFSFQFQRGSNL